jgi:hypothetical protein
MAVYVPSPLELAGSATDIGYKLLHIALHNDKVVVVHHACFRVDN